MLSSMEEGVLVALTPGRESGWPITAFVSGFGLGRDPVGRSILEVLGEPEVHRLLVETLEGGNPPWSASWKWFPARAFVTSRCGRCP
jgi:hypothetical protein